MEKDRIAEILRQVENGSLSAEDAMLELKLSPFEDLGYAKVDHHRAIRQGISEVIYGAGKTPEQICGIVASMLSAGQKTILITRLEAYAAELIAKSYPLDYRKDVKVGIIGNVPAPNGNGIVLIATGGTSDIPVAEEAALTAEVLGNEVLRLYDVGVSGVHRLFHFTKEIMSASVIIAVAGMEGALASVIGGVADCPVIAVPTSVGYGASFGGLAALLSMLNSCAGGVSVVNIDNGYCAGYLASMINHIRNTK
jgi:pyridinium-3,5-biscarboxylic acid mononucleotide synthase